MSKIIFRKDVPQTKALVKAARISAKRAFSGSKALGLTITYIKDGVVYEEEANGTVVIKKQIEKAVNVPFEFKKGLVLHAK
ncbi:hypothetical protein [Flavobacterium sp. UBA6135]|uniref:hypothetical protein n=1 Tax=Flavobacterium sp. UBA6135 TaxID=1946553 RepID=UPI0025C569B8|nr:hypothetical protein [Flavobacterium sp. UBA6135]